MSEHEITLSDEDLGDIRDVLDRELSCGDAERQDRALELLDKLPESNTSYRYR